MSSYPLLPSHSKKLYSKRVLVFGGTSGIGFATACAAYDNGARVIVSSSSSERVGQAVERIRRGYPSPPSTSSIRGIPCNLGDPAKLEGNLTTLLDEAIKDGSLDHIAFVAGDPLSIVPLAQISAELIQKAGTVRFVAPLLLSKLIQRRNEGGGSISYLTPSPDSSLTLISGTASLKTPEPGWAVIAGYASASEGSMRALAKDMKPIRVNAVSPGVVDTEIFEKMPEDQRKNMKANLKKETATDRIGRPEDLAEAFLSCMRDGFFTGQVVCSDGGRQLN